MTQLDLEFIKRRRKEIKLTQDNMAKKLGMNGKSVYSTYEKGIYTLDSNHGPLIAKALKVKIEDLYTSKISKIEI